MKVKNIPASHDIAADEHSVQLQLGRAEHEGTDHYSLASFDLKKITIIITKQKVTNCIHWRFRSEQQHFAFDLPT